MTARVSPWKTKPLCLSAHTPVVCAMLLFGFWGVFLLLGFPSSEFCPHTTNLQGRACFNVLGMHGVCGAAKRSVVPQTTCVCIWYRFPERLTSHHTASHDSGKKTTVLFWGWVLYARKYVIFLKRKFILKDTGFCHHKEHLLPKPKIHPFPLPF